MKSINYIGMAIILLLAFVSSTIDASDRLERDTELVRQPIICRPLVRDLTPEQLLDVPDSVDWREKGAVTNVKDQGDCNAGYAFAMIGAVEAQNFLENGTLKSLSAQQIIDCSKNEFNKGCTGGRIKYSMEYVKSCSNDGINTDEIYPYQEKANDQCQMITDNEQQLAKSVQNFAYDQLLTDEQLKYYVSKHPVAVSFVVREKFRRYKSGVFSDKYCNQDYYPINHYMLIIGYGTDPDEGDYWLVKNSWGTEWGENGYARIARGKNMCKINTQIVYSN